MDNERKQYLMEMQERLNAHVDSRVGKVETNLLTAFHGWARLALAEERIFEPERKRK